MGSFVSFMKEKFIWDDKKSCKDRILLFTCECLGTMIFLGVTCMGCVQMWRPLAAPRYQIDLLTGLAYMLGVQVGYNISGGHINPAVTLASCLLGKMAWINLVLYTVAQVSGGFVGYLIVWCMTSSEFIKEDSTYICSPVIGFDLSWWQALLTEAKATFIFILAWCGVWDSRNKGFVGCVPLKLAIVVAGESLAFDKFSSCMMNPARSLGPAVISKAMDYQCIWWLGPFIGAVGASVLYRLVWALPRDQE